MNKIEEKENEYIFENSVDGSWNELYKNIEKDPILGEVYEVQHLIG